MKENVYISLLYKQLSGEIQSEEQQQLETWIQESPENQQIAKSVENAWTLGAKYTSEVPVDLDQDFELLQQRIRKEEKTATIEKVHPKAPVAKKRFLFSRKLQIAAGILFFVIAGFLLQPFISGTPKWQEFHASTQQKKAIPLADGSKVWVNAGSTFAYPDVFNGKERRVKLTGEAFFEVTPDAEHPFIIETNSGNVLVLGTSFNVRDFKNEGVMAVDVVTGKVQVQVEETKEKIVLVENQQCVYNKESKTLKQMPSGSLNGSAWHTRKFHFSNTKLTKALKTIESVYDVSISIEKSELGDCPLTSRFNRLAIQPLLENVSSVFGMELVKENERQYLLKGGACNSK